LFESQLFFGKYESPWTKENNCVFSFGDGIPAMIGQSIAEKLKY
jgi:hypothetical protein